MLRDSPSVGGYEYDVFISHATEDKDFATPLALALREAGLKVWYDDFELSIGESLNESINYGLSRSRYGVVVLSSTFFKKHWTQLEMNGFVARQTSGERVILPIWHKITKTEIIQHAPPLADIVALNSSTHTTEAIVEEIVQKVGSSNSIGGTPHAPATAPPTISYNFAVFYVAQANTAELPKGEEPKPSFMNFEFPPAGWLSLVNEDEELEFDRQGQTLRVRLDYGNRWSGSEYLAHQLVTGDQPFALTIRPKNGQQIYLPSVVNTSPFGGPMSSGRSGWMVFEIL